ncbi:odorant receptor 30a-like isoform X2 [Cylas formicarius]|uniref:odorant receptor 30a-like isoform X2 n=1 Tax=Cylas formicarius TaxID=197179 RepID=UPI002958D6F8|nr:odorant receptor 30a-like isoform X2 [Cylas formicarius]
MCFSDCFLYFGCSLLKSNQTEAFSNIGVIIFFAIIITKMLMCQSQSIVNLIRIAVQPNFQAVKHIDMEVESIYKKQTKLNNYLITIVIGSMTVVTISFAVFGDFNCYRHFKQYSNGTNKPMLVNYWYPFDTNQYYALVLIDQNIRVTLSAFCTATVNAFVICIIIFVRLQLKLLQYSFRNFHKLTRDKNSAEGASVLKQLCQKHLDLIGYIADLNQSFNVIVFMEYMISSITFAAQILQIIDGGEKLLFACGVLSYTIMQLLIFSWSSNEIIIQSKELATAVFESNWYDYDKEIKVMAHIMIMRCQKPLSLTIGRFGVMDLDVGVSRLKLAYSYTSVMTSGD